VSSAAHASHSSHHITPLKTYYGIFGALIVLTGLTYAVSFAGFPPVQSVIIAMAVAMTKASLVALWFMHLKYDTKFNIFVFVSALWFMAVFFVFTMFDLGSRGRVLEDTDNFALRKDLAAAAAPAADASAPAAAAPAADASAPAADGSAPAADGAAPAAAPAADGAAPAAAPPAATPAP